MTTTIVRIERRYSGLNVNVGEVCGLPGHKANLLAQKGIVTILTPAEIAASTGEAETGPAAQAESEPGISDMSVREARPVVADCENISQLLAWTQEEKANQDRRSILDMLKARLEALTGNAD